MIFSNLWLVEVKYMLFFQSDFMHSYTLLSCTRIFVIYLFVPRVLTPDMNCYGKEL